MDSRTLLWSRLELGQLRSADQNLPERICQYFQCLLDCRTGVGSYKDAQRPKPEFPFGLYCPQYALQALGCDHGTVHRRRTEFA